MSAMTTEGRAMRMMEIEDSIYDKTTHDWVEAHAKIVQTRDEADKDYHTNFNRIYEKLLSENAEYVALKNGAVA